MTKVPATAPPAQRARAWPAWKKNPILFVGSFINSCLGDIFTRLQVLANWVIQYATSTYHLFSGNRVPTPLNWSMDPSSFLDGSLAKKAVSWTWIPDSPVFLKWKCTHKTNVGQRMPKVDVYMYIYIYVYMEIFKNISTYIWYVYIKIYAYIYICRIFHFWPTGYMLLLKDD